MKVWMNQFLKMKQIFNIVCVNLDILSLHVHSQNTGLIVQKSSDQYSFKSFKVSPITEAVIEIKSWLWHCFPDSAVIIDQDWIVNVNFLKLLMKLLIKLNAEMPEEVLLTAIKAHSKVIEIRDTVHLKFITELLISIL